MERQRWSRLAAILPACSAGLLLLSGLAAVADDRQGEEAIKPLVVMIRSALASGEEEVGAGIIFGQRGSSLYVLTANHVVRQGGHDATSVRVQFRWLPGEQLTAKLLEDADSQLDWAVLKVENVDGLPPNGLPFAQLGDPSSVKRGDRVFLLGNPTGHSWEINVTPDGVTNNNGSSIFFESIHLEPGHSGGALLDDHFRVVGLLKLAQAPHGEAVNIQVPLNSLRQRGYPVSLERGGGSPPPAAAPTPTPVAAPAPAPAQDRVTFRDWAGSWDLQWEFGGKWYGAAMKLRADTSGISGVYDLGSIRGGFAGGDVSSVRGKYVNTTGTGQDCPNGEQFGLFTFNLRADGQAMDGWWDLCGEGEKRRWRATKNVATGE